MKGVQFRSKELPNIIYNEEIRKVNLRSNPYYLLDNPEEAPAKPKRSKNDKYKKLKPQTNLSYSEVMSRPKAENVEYLKRKISEEQQQRLRKNAIDKYSRLPINYLM